FSVVVRYPNRAKHDTSLAFTLVTANGDNSGVIFGRWHDLTHLYGSIDDTVHPIRVLLSNLLCIVFASRQHHISTGAFHKCFIIYSSIGHHGETLGLSKLDDVATQGSGCPGYGKNRTFGQVEGVQRQSRSQTVHGQR